MSVNIRYPNITGGTEREQMSQVKSYLHQLVEQLNYALPTIGTVDGSTQSASSGTHDVQGGELSYYELKSLIVHELQQIDAEVAKAVDEALEKAIENGEFNGVSPTVSVTEIDGGHRVTITDKDGEKTFDVMDGKDGTGGGGTSEAIIDVVELPTENIDENSFYRLVVGTILWGATAYEGGACYCVNGLPEEGEPASNADMSKLNAYYNIMDGLVYGYVNADLSYMLGVPIGWYELGMLLAGVGIVYNGVITNTDDAKIDRTIRILLKYEIYQNKNGWWNFDTADWNVNNQFAPGYIANRTHYEVPNDYEITWDGNMEGRTAVPLDAFGNSYGYLVKVSDKVYRKDELLGKYYGLTEDIGFSQHDISAQSLIEIPGGFACSSFEFAVIQSADETSAALGAPQGYITNGTYFLCEPGFNYYINSIFNLGYVKPLDEKYLPSSTLKKNTITADKRIVCTPDQGWVESAVANISENIPGNILDLEVTIVDPDNSQLGYVCRLTLCMSAHTDEPIGCCFAEVKGELYQIFVKMHIRAKRVFVAAKTVIPEKDNNLASDHIVEQGTSGIWTYRKWNSGKIELWTNNHQFPVSFTKSSIGVYYATESGIAVPLVKTIEFASGDCTKWHYVNWASVTCNDGLTLGIRYYGLDANGGGNTIPFSFYVIGTWK